MKERYTQVLPHVSSHGISELPRVHLSSKTLLEFVFQK